jgi:hypothetical protein
MTVRFSAVVGSPVRPFVDGESSEEVSTAGRSLGTPPADKFAGCRSSSRPCRVGWSLEGISPDSGSAMIHDEACWFSERLSWIGESTGEIAVIAATERGGCGFALFLRTGMLKDAEQFWNGDGYESSDEDGDESSDEEDASWYEMVRGGHGLLVLIFLESKDLQSSAFRGMRNTCQLKQTGGE